MVLAAVQTNNDVYTFKDMMKKDDPGLTSSRQ